VRTLSALGMLLFLCCGSYGQNNDFRSGNYLLTACTDAVKDNEGDHNRDRYRIGYCSGFVTAMTESIDTLKHELPSGKAVPYACVPSQVTNGQVLRIVAKYLNDHPEDLHKAAYSLGLRALSDAFPCKR
jgi:hypothetical protein